jgi:hypothetical protein
VRIVEAIKRERWEGLRDRRGDAGRNLALWAARRYCRSTLGELAEGRIVGWNPERTKQDHSTSQVSGADAMRKLEM